MKNNSILINQIFPTSGISSYVKNILLILFGSFLLAVSSKVQVPFLASSNDNANLCSFSYWQ